jgi:hypothetical protein
MKTTERERQLKSAIEFSQKNGLKTISTFMYKCEDGNDFEAIAPTETGALRVLNAERPGMRAELDLVSYKWIEELS